MSSQNITPKDCSYGCNTRIYWSVAENAYFEIITKQKHICKNRYKPNIHNSVVENKPNYYNRFTKQPKPKTCNSIELLSGSISEVQKKYEILSDIVIEYNGHVHGSQSTVNGNNISLVVYFEVQEDRLNEFKQKFSL